MKISLDLVVQIWSYCWLLFALTLIMQTPEVCPEYRSGVKTDPRSLISSHYQRAPAERDFAGSGFTYHSYPPLSLLLHKRRVPWDTASRNGKFNFVLLFLVFRPVNLLELIWTKAD